MTAPAHVQFAPRSPARVGQEHAQHTLHATPIGMLTRKIQCQLRARENAAEQHAEAAAAGADKAVDAHGLGPLPGFGEQIHDQRKRDRRHHRAAQPLDGARGDQHGLRVGHAAGGGGQREDGEPPRRTAAGGRTDRPAGPPSNRKPPKVSM